MLSLYPDSGGGTVLTGSNEEQEFTFVVPEKQKERKKRVMTKGEGGT